MNEPSLEPALPEGVVAHTRDVVLTRPGISDPIFFAVERGRIFVARALEPLLAALREKRAFCMDRLASWLVLATPPDACLTAYEGVYRVPTQHVVHLWPDGRFTRTFLARAIEPAEGLTAEDAVHELRARLMQAIARLAAGRRRIAILAGGGVDSSTVLASAVAWARQANGAEIEAIAVHFASRGDDRPYLRELADSLGIVPIRISPALGGPLVRRMMVLDGAPLPWPNASFEGAALSCARERGADVAWGGAGGDALYEGNVTSLATRALSRSPRDMYASMRDAAALRVSWREPGIGQIWDFVARPILVSGVPHPVRTLRRRRHAKKRAAWAGPELRAWMHRRAADRDPSWDDSPSGRYMKFVTHPFLLEGSDSRAQVGRSLGIERVDPLLDDELIAFISSLPPMFLLYGGRTRGLLRAAMAGLVPDAVRLRTDKASFEPAMAEAVRAGGGFEALEDLAQVRRLTALGLVEGKAYRETFDALARDPEGWGHGWIQVWPALALEAFLAWRGAGLQGALC